ncbi:MAG: alpha/beta fold hydrolase [Actinomycetes bacterium]
MRRFSPALCLSLAALVALVSCGSSTSVAPSTTASIATTSTVSATPPTTTVTPTTALSADFYQPPSNLSTLKPGDLIRSTLFSTTNDFTAFTVLYASRSVSNAPVVVSGMVWVPNTPTAGNPLISYAHGTTGIADECAPSKSNGAGETGVIANILVPKGYIFAATDYEGLGTPGVHPYVVGISEAHSMLDIIRAARQLTESSGKSVVWGHSQGGGAALMAAEVAPKYAPDTQVIGAVGGAPVVELDKLSSVFSTTDSFGFMFMVAAGFRAAYPDLDLSKLMTQKGLDMVALAESTCTDVITTVRGTDVKTYLSAASLNAEPLLSHLEANTPGNAATNIPIFVYHGEADELIPAATSLQYFQRACATGGYNIERKTYPGASHVSVLFSASEDIQRWIADRFNAIAPTPTPCG